MNRINRMLASVMRHNEHQHLVAIIFLDNGGYKSDVTIYNTSTKSTRQISGYFNTEDEAVNNVYAVAERFKVPSKAITVIIDDM